MQTVTTSFTSPIGIIRITCSGEYITALNFIDEGATVTNNNHFLLQECKTQLHQYFSGERKSFELPMAPLGTSFQTKVWELLCKIPFGKTISYMDLAKQYGDVKSIRAVASANGKNGLMILIPCHRVIGSSAKLTGYAGGLWRKQWLLEHEAKYHSGVQQLF